MVRNYISLGGKSMSSGMKKKKKNAYINVTLTILLIYFIIHLTSQFLFLYIT